MPVSVLDLLSDDAAGFDSALPPSFDDAFEVESFDFDSFAVDSFAVDSFDGPGLGRRALLPRLGGIVGDVPAAALQDERRRREEPVDRAAAAIAGLERGLGDALAHFEDARDTSGIHTRRSAWIKGIHGAHEGVKASGGARAARVGPLLPACATTTADDEIRRLEARSAYEAGVKSISEGRVSLGLASLRQAAEVEPENALYHNAVGAVLLNVGRYPDAQAEFQKAVELDPTYADAYHNLGSSYAEQGKWEEAITAYKKALAQTDLLDPGDHVQQPGLRLLGARSPHRRRRRRSAPRCSSSRSWCPRTSGSGSCSRRKGKKDEARLHFQAARDLEPASLLGKRAAEVLKAIGDGG